MAVPPPPGGQHLCYFLRTKESVYIKEKSLTPARISWYTNMAAISFFWKHQYSHRNFMWKRFTIGSSQPRSKDWWQGRIFWLNGFISLACGGSETHNLQAVLFVPSYLVQKSRLWSQAFLADSAGTRNGNRCVTEATHDLRRKVSLRAFPERVCPRILSLESADYFGTSNHFGGRKKKKRRILISKTSIGSAANFHWM